MPTAYPIIGMNLSSSQMKLVQSWGLGHSNPTFIYHYHFEEPYKEGAILYLGRNFNKNKVPSTYTKRILPVLYMTFIW